MQTPEEDTHQEDPSTVTGGSDQEPSGPTETAGPADDDRQHQRELEDQQREAQRERQRAQRAVEEGQGDAQRQRQQAQRELEDRQRSGRSNGSSGAPKKGMNQTIDRRPDGDCAAPGPSKSEV
jgi:hypothetical protein